MRRAILAAMAGILAVVVASAAPPPQQVSELIALATPLQATWFALARNGSLAAAVCGNSKLLLWSLPDGTLKRTLDLPARDADAFAISDNGRFIFLGDHRGLATVWDSSTGAIRMEHQFPHYFAFAAFSHDARLLAIAPMGLPIQVFEVATNEQRFELPQTTGGSGGLAFSPDDSLLASADADTVVRIYRVRDAKLLAANSDFLSEPFAVDFTRESKQVIAAGADKTVVFLDAFTGKSVRRLPKMPDPIFGLGVSPDGALLGTVFLHSDNLEAPAPIAVWDISTGAVIQQWTPADRALGGGWTDDGRLIVATVTPEKLHLWRLQ